jgi:DNA repair protein RecO (recombination protein O)
MIENAQGLILRTRPLTESSLIVHWLTREAGRIATVAKGAHRPKSPFSGRLDLFYLADISFSRNARSELHNLREVKLLETHDELRRDLRRLEQASYCAQLLEQSTEVETPLPDAFGLMKALLRHLTDFPPRVRTVFAFELKLLDQLGLRPNLDQMKDPATGELLQKLQESDWSKLGNIKADPAQAKKLGQFLHGFLIYHLGRIPLGRAKAMPEAVPSLVPAPTTSRAL